MATRGGDRGRACACRRGTSHDFGDALPPEGIHPDAGKATAATARADGLHERTGRARKPCFPWRSSGGTCGGCHGADGKGITGRAGFDDRKWLWSDGSLQGLETTIKNGVPEPKAHPGAMPPMGGVVLSQADLDAVSAYVWALGHKNP